MLRGYSGFPLQNEYGITVPFLRPPGAVINTADKKRGNFLSIFWVVKLKKVSNTVMGGLFQDMANEKVKKLKISKNLSYEDPKMSSNKVERISSCSTKCKHFVNNGIPRL